MPRRRLVVALLFTAAGITPLAALGVAWGEQQPGWTSESTVTVSGRVAKTFPAPAKPSTTPAASVAAPATATGAAAVPQPAGATATTAAPTQAPATTAKPEAQPTGKPSRTKPADPDPTETATAPADPTPTAPPAVGGN